MRLRHLAAFQMLPAEAGPGRPWFRSHPRWALLAVLGMFAAVLVLRLLAGDTSESAISLLYTLPVALAAVAFGRTAGLGAGLLAVALIVVWSVAREPDLSWIGWTTRIVPLLLLGGLLGDTSERFAREQQRRLSLEAAAQRHRDAAEISDSLIQGMTAARWALEAERHDVALSTLEDTLSRGQQLVSELLRGADLRPGQHGPTDHA